MIKKSVLIIVTLSTVLLCGCNDSDSAPNSSVTTSSPVVDDTDTSTVSGNTKMVTQLELIKNGVVQDGNYEVKGNLEIDNYNQVIIKKNATLTIK
ncbi:hypothetical protein NGM67_04820 [Photobacterium damselae]|uniref:hypothetical protein n=1 Tax=Photobacterium damselae TaxID=38293 RepID=UPI002090188A|nr:hypothetical protein [Photobacterium damselae]USR75350.1 hypothetical protein NGM67_04820 [Photobacterium damselae]